MEIEKHLEEQFIDDLKQIVWSAREKSYQSINFAQVEGYWLLGRSIVEKELQGKDKAEYGAKLMKILSIELTKEFGKGFTVGSLYYYKQFYQIFPEIFATPWRILTWSHYKRLFRVDNMEARFW